MVTIIFTLVNRSNRSQNKKAWIRKWNEIQALKCLIKSAVDAWPGLVTYLQLCVWCRLGAGDAVLTPGDRGPGDAISDHPSPESPLSCPCTCVSQSEAELRRQRPIRDLDTETQTRCSASITPGQLVTVCQTILKCPLTLTPNESLNLIFKGIAPQIMCSPRDDNIVVKRL